MTVRTVSIFWTIVALMIWLLLLSGTWLTWWTIKPKVLGVAGIIVIVIFVLEAVVGFRHPRRAPD